MSSKTLQHTPGPWIVSPARFDRPISGGPVTFTFYVRAPDRQGDSQSVLEEAHANARLIATAPELLEALKEAVLYIGAAGEYGCPTAEKALSAIAKAEGDAYNPRPTPARSLEGPDDD